MDFNSLQFLQKKLASTTDTVISITLPLDN